MQLFTSDEEHLNIPLHKLKKAKKNQFFRGWFPFYQKKEDDSSSIRIDSVLASKTLHRLSLFSPAGT